jgi:hypothetical protein
MSTEIIYPFKERLIGPCIGNNIREGGKVKKSEKIRIKCLTKYSKSAKFLSCEIFHTGEMNEQETSQQRQ